jgi:hypothetical protein
MLQNHQHVISLFEDCYIIHFDRTSSDCASAAVLKTRLGPPPDSVGAGLKKLALSPT